MLVPESLDNLVTAREAAEYCGVALSTMHSWVAKGDLRPSDVDSSGHRLYKLIYVLRASKGNRDRAIGRGRIR